MKTIEITTAHHIALEYELASARERLLAFVIDCFAILALNMFVQTFWSVVFGQGLGGAGAASALVPFALLVSYFAAMEVLYNGQTIGKMALGIRTVRLDGKQPKWSEMLGRSILHFVDSIFSLGFIGILLIKTTEKGQRLGDMAAGTAVIKLRVGRGVRLHDVLRLDTVKAHTPVFPQVRALREADMVTVKTIIDRYLKHPNEAHHEVVVETSERLAKLLGIGDLPPDRVGFLRGLLKDYVVLTR